MNDDHRADARKDAVFGLIALVEDALDALPTSSAQGHDLHAGATARLRGAVTAMELVPEGAPGIVLVNGLPTPTNQQEAIPS